MKNYGKELILDLHECNPEKFTRYHIRRFFMELCSEIDMEACKISWWDYKNYPEEYAKAPPHLKGTSAVQFISTSNITIHVLDDMKCVYLNIFSCKDFDSSGAVIFCIRFFGAGSYTQQTITRG